MYKLLVKQSKFLPLSYFGCKKKKIPRQVKNYFTTSINNGKYIKRTNNKNFITKKITGNYFNTKSEKKKSLVILVTWGISYANLLSLSKEFEKLYLLYLRLICVILTLCRLKKVQNKFKLVDLFLVFFLF